jgi:hypothetical protein
MKQRGSVGAGIVLVLVLWVLGVPWAGAWLTGCQRDTPSTDRSTGPRVLAESLEDPASAGGRLGWYPNDPLTPTYYGGSHICAWQGNRTSLCAEMNGALEAIPTTHAGNDFITVGGYSDGDLNWPAMKQVHLFSSSKAFDSTYTGQYQASGVGDWTMSPTYPGNDRLPYAAQGHVYLPNSRLVLVAGGLIPPSVDDTFLYDPATDTWVELLAADQKLPNKQHFWYSHSFAWTCGLQPKDSIRPGVPALTTGIDCAILIGGVNEEPSGAPNLTPTGDYHVASIHTYLFIRNPVTRAVNWVTMDQPDDPFTYFSKVDYRYHNSNDAGCVGSCKAGVMDGALVPLTPACSTTNASATSEADNPLAPAHFKCNSSPGNSNGRAYDHTLAGNAPGATGTYFPQFVYIGGRRFAPTITAGTGVNTALILNNWCVAGTNGCPLSGSVSPLIASTPLHAVLSNGTNNPTSASWRFVTTSTDGPRLTMPATCANADHSAFQMDGVAPEGGTPGTCDDRVTASEDDFAEDDFQWSLTSPRYVPCGANNGHRCGTVALTLVGHAKTPPTPTRILGPVDEVKPQLYGHAIPDPNLVAATMLARSKGSRMGLTAISERGGQVWVVGGLAQITDYDYPEMENFASRRSNLYLEGTAGDPGECATRGGNCCGTNAEIRVRSPALRTYHGFGQLSRVNPSAAPQLEPAQVLIFGGLNRNLSVSIVSERWAYDQANARFDFVAPDDSFDFFIKTSWNTFNNGTTYSGCTSDGECSQESACLNAAGTNACGGAAGCKCATAHGFQYPYAAESASGAGGVILLAGGYDNLYSIVNNTWSAGEDVSSPRTYSYKPWGSDPRNLVGCPGQPAAAPPSVCGGNADASPLDRRCRGFVPDVATTPAAVELACSTPKTANLDANAFAFGAAQLRSVLAQDERARYPAIAAAKTSFSGTPAARAAARHASYSGATFTTRSPASPSLTAIGP